MPTGGAEAWIHVPGLGDKFRPTAASLLEEVGDFGLGRRRYRSRRHEPGALRVRRLRDVGKDRPGIRGLGRRHVDRRVLEPFELASEGRGEGTVRSTRYFEAQQNMVNEVCEELDRAEELVIGTEARVELRALLTGQSPQPVKR